MKKILFIVLILASFRTYAQPHYWQLTNDTFGILSNDLADTFLIIVGTSESEVYSNNPINVKGYMDSTEVMDSILSYNGGVPQDSNWVRITADTAKLKYINLNDGNYNYIRSRSSLIIQNNGTTTFEDSLTDIKFSVRQNDLISYKKHYHYSSSYEDSVYATKGWVNANDGGGSAQDSVFVRVSVDSIKAKSNGAIAFDGNEVKGIRKATGDTANFTTYLNIVSGGGADSNFVFIQTNAINTRSGQNIAMNDKDLEDVNKMDSDTAVIGKLSATTLYGNITASDKNITGINKATGDSASFTRMAATKIYWADTTRTGNGTLVLNCGSWNYFKITMNGNVTLDLKNQKVGDYKILLTQDGTGSRTVAYSSTEWTAQDGLVNVNHVANSKTLISGFYDGAIMIVTSVTFLVGL
jgi:hypothetical protein